VPKVLQILTLLVAYLFQTGKQQHFELGKWFRQRYNSLVSEKYNNSEMYVRSTDVDRTLMSALSNLAGFFPPQGKDVWNEELAWQPIPVHTMPEKQDDTLAAKKPCPVYDYELKKLLKSEEFKTYDKNLKPIYKYLTEHAGKTVNSLQSVQNIYSCLHIEEIYNLELPEWTKEVYPDKLKPISGLSFAVKTYTPLLARLKTGPLLKEILTHFKDKINKKLSPNRSYWVYSAHDTTVANMLNTLGVFKTMGYHNPPYASTVMFELREYSDGHRVQVFYKNTTAEPKPLDLPGCGTSCPLDKMFELYKTVLPVHWADECTLSLLQMPLSASVDESISFYGIFAFVAVMMMAGFIVLFFATVYKRRDYIAEEKWNSIGGWN
jgi:lysosomal acid phosphatase